MILNMKNKSPIFSEYNLYREIVTDVREGSMQAAQARTKRLKKLKEVAYGNIVYLIVE